MWYGKKAQRGMGHGRDPPRPTSVRRWNSVLCDQLSKSTSSRGMTYCHYNDGETLQDRSILNPNIWRRPPDDRVCNRAATRASGMVARVQPLVTRSRTLYNEKDSSCLSKSSRCTRYSRWVLRIICRLPL